MVLEIVHRIPGRFRIQSLDLRNRPELLKRIEEEFKSNKGVNEFQINRITGSILVLYDVHKVGEEELLKRLVELSGIPLNPSMDRGKGGEGGKIPRVPYIAEAIQEPFRRLNKDILLFTKGYMDLRYLAPVLLAAYGTVKLIRQGPIPAIPWYLLYWWSFRTFVYLNRQTL